MSEQKYGAAITDLFFEGQACCVTDFSKLGINLALGQVGKG